MFTKLINLILTVCGALFVALVFFYAVGAVSPDTKKPQEQHSDAND